MNEQLTHEKDANPGFTLDTRHILYGVESYKNARSSLDFDHQKMIDIHQATNRYKISSRLSVMKQRFSGTNRMMDMGEYIHRQIQALSANSF